MRSSQESENHGVAGSIPALATNLLFRMRPDCNERRGVALGKGTGLAVLCPRHSAVSLVLSFLMEPRVVLTRDVQLSFEVACRQLELVSADRVCRKHFELEKQRIPI